MGLFLEGLNMNSIFKKKKNQYYSLDRIKKENAVYNMVFGERSNGKTYSVLLEGLENYFKDGGQIAIVRRWKEDIIGRRASGIFSAINENDEVYKYSNGEYQGITYLPDEFVLFMNTISTIVRKRTDVKIFMMGNTVNKYSPYFSEMGLNHVDKMKQGTIDLYKYGKSGLTVAVEYAENTSNNKENNFYFAFNNPKLEMITGGAWELDIYPHAPIKYKPHDIQFIYFIEFSDKIYQCEIVVVDDITFTFIHDKTTPIKNPDDDLIYTLEYNPKLNYNRDIFTPINKVQERVAWYFKTNRVYYQDNEVGNAISNFLKESR